MKILLIDPPFYRLIGFYNRYFPLGLVSVGTALQHAGHDVTVYDADFNDAPSAMDYTRLPEYYPRYLDSFRDSNHPTWLEVRRTVEQTRPDVVGISVWTAYAASAFRVAEISKAVDPTCPVVVGGPHATVRAEEILRISPAVDCVVRGEGEITMVDLMARIRRTDRELNAVAGLSFRMGHAVRHNPPRQRIRNLDELPLPDRGLLVHRDTYSPEDMGLVMTGRGCPFACSFCATETRQVRYHSIAHILAEIRQVEADYGTTQFSFKDDSFTVSAKRVIEFCDALIRENLDIGWECNTRADLVSEEMLVRMRQAGCNSIKVGIESGSEPVLERMNKGITLDQARKAAGLLRKAGIYWTGYFLIGTPGETLEDIYKTLDFMYEIRPDFASLGVYEPFPGAAMFDDGVKRGLVKPDMTGADFYATLPNDYYRAAPRRHVETMTPEEFAAVEREVKDRFHRYNGHWRRILNRARARTAQYVRSPHVLYTDFRKYLSWR